MSPYVAQIGVGMIIPALVCAVSDPKVFGIKFPDLEFAAVPINTPVLFIMPKKAVPEVLVN